MPDQQEPRIGQQIGEYRLVSKLGDGSFGTVYLAEHVHEQGFGLRLMQERVQEIQGIIDVQTTPGHGTCVSICLPKEGSDDSRCHCG